MQIFKYLHRCLKNTSQYLFIKTELNIYMNDHVKISVSDLLSTHNYY